MIKKNEAKQILGWNFLFYSVNEERKKKFFYPEWKKIISSTVRNWNTGIALEWAHIYIE